MELVYEWVVDADDDELAARADAIEDAWFARPEDMLRDIEDLPARPTLRGRMMRLIGFA